MLSTLNHIYPFKSKTHTSFNIRLKTMIYMILCSFPVLSYSAELHHMHGMRYCEILLSKGRNIEVYTTLNLNNCPDKLWKQITVQSIKQETHAFQVYLNGPRRFVIDGLKNATLVDPTPRLFQGLAMRKAATLHLSLFDIFFGARPYHKHTVNRNTTWIYKANSRIYELLSPKGEVYVMQSYPISEEFREASLKTLDSSLHLPDGWQFKTGLLKETKELVAINDKAYVLQDDHENTYQQATHDFL